MSFTRVGFEWFTVAMSYGPRWRDHRRAFHATISADIVPQYQGLQLGVARNFLRLLLRGPHRLASHVKLRVSPLRSTLHSYLLLLVGCNSTSAAVFMGAIYGIELCEPQDQYYQILERVAEVGETIAIPGNFPVEAFPVLRYLPSWFPGGGFISWAARAKEDILYVVDDLFHSAKDGMVRFLLR